MESTLKNEKLFSRNFVLTTLSTFAVFTISAVLLRPYLGREVDRRGRKNILAAGLLVFLFSMLLYNYTMGIFGVAANVAMAIGPMLSFALLHASSFSTLFAVSAAIALGMVLQFFGFKVMYLLGGLIVLAGAAWFIAVNDKKGI